MNRWFWGTVVAIFIFFFLLLLGGKIKRAIIDGWQTFKLCIISAILGGTAVIYLELFYIDIDGILGG